MNRGWIKLWRKTKDTGLSCLLLGMWAQCLIETTNVQHSAPVCGQRIELFPGQFIFGRHAWAEKLGLTEKVTRNLIGTLQKRAMIRAITRASKFTVFEVTNWADYQQTGSTRGQQTGQHEGQHEGQQRASRGPHLKNGENGENKDLTPPTPLAGGYSASFLEFWAAYPLQRGKGAAFKSWQDIPKKHPGVKPPQIIAAIKAQVSAGIFTNVRGEFNPPHPATWLNQARWDDTVAAGPSELDREQRKAERAAAERKVAEEETAKKKTDAVWEERWSQLPESERDTWRERASGRNPMLQSAREKGQIALLDAVARGLWRKHQDGAGQ